MLRISLRRFRGPMARNESCREENSRPHYKSTQRGNVSTRSPCMQSTPSSQYNGRMWSGHNRRISSPNRHGITRRIRQWSYRRRPRIRILFDQLRAAVYCHGYDVRYILSSSDSSSTLRPRRHSPVKCSRHERYEGKSGWLGSGSYYREFSVRWSNEPSLSRSREVAWVWQSCHFEHVE